MTSHKADVSLFAVWLGFVGDDRGLAAWMAGEDATLIKPESRSTRQVIGTMDITEGQGFRVEIDRYNGASFPDRATRFLPLNISVLPTSTPAKLLCSAELRAEISSLWVAANLAERDRCILVYCGSQIEVSQGRFLEALKNWGNACQDYFVVPQEGEAGSLYDQALAATADYCGTKSREYRLLRRGIASHHGQLPHVVRRLITRLIRQRILRVVHATSTLTEGVNLPLDMVILPKAGRTFYDERKKRRVHACYSPSEFLNLAGRAGRPGVKRSMEGITVTAMPSDKRLRSLYDEMLQGLERSGIEEHRSPLQVLITLIVELAEESGLCVDGLDVWLSDVDPATLDESRSFLADGVDSLDLVLLQTLVEAEALQGNELSASEREQCLRELWKATFAAVAAVEETRLEALLLLRGKAVYEEVYADSQERRALYMLGLPPRRGRQFAPKANMIERLLRGGEKYAEWSNTERLEYLIEIVASLKDDSALGFPATDTARDKKIQSEWIEVLKWWLGEPSKTGPTESKIRYWLKFVQTQFDYRTGTAVGAVLARVWDRTAPGEAPTLERWQEVTMLPWVAYWLRELFRWGTPEPVCAYLLSRQRIVARADAQELIADYYAWLTENGHTTPTDRLDPALIRTWETEQFFAPVVQATRRNHRVPLDVEPTFADVEDALMAWPLDSAGGQIWIDPAGYKIGTSAKLDMRATNRTFFTANLASRRINCSEEQI